MSSLVADVRQVARGWRWTRRPPVPRGAQTLAPVAGAPEFPTEWARTPAARAVRRVLLRSVFRPLVWTETAPRVEGLDRLHEVEPPVVFVANHASHLDTPLVLCALPPAWRERTAVAAAADYFFDVWWRAAGTALAFNTFPIERSGGAGATATASAVLGDGWNVLVFPEGTRSRDGWLGRVHSGAARLCLEQGVAAVPVSIRGTFVAMPRGRSWPRAGRASVSVRFGPAVRAAEAESHGELTARLTTALSRLADEDRTTWWESVRREALGTTPSLSGPDGATWRRVWEASRPLRASRRPRAWARR